MPIPCICAVRQCAASPRPSKKPRQRHGDINSVTPWAARAWWHRPVSRPLHLESSLRLHPRLQPSPRDALRLGHHQDVVIFEFGDEVPLKSQRTRPDTVFDQQVDSRSSVAGVGAHVDQGLVRARFGLDNRASSFKRHGCRGQDAQSAALKSADQTRLSHPSMPVWTMGCWHPTSVVAELRGRSCRRHLASAVCGGRTSRIKRSFSVRVRECWAHRLDVHHIPMRPVRRPSPW